MTEEFAPPAAVAKLAEISPQLLNGYCRSLIGGELVEGAKAAAFGGGWHMWRRHGALQVVLSAALIRRGVRVRAAFDAMQDFFQDGGLGRDHRIDRFGHLSRAIDRPLGAPWKDGRTLIIWRDNASWLVLHVAEGTPQHIPCDLIGMLSFEAASADLVVIDVNTLSERVAAIFDPVGA